MEQSKGSFREHIACIQCSSSDGLAIYEDDNREVLNGYCFSCHTWFSKERLEGMPLKGYSYNQDSYSKESLESVQDYPIEELTDRGISLDAAKYYGVRVSFNESTREIEKHFYPVYKMGEDDRPYLSGYKVRTVKTKEFTSIGDTKNALPFGWQTLKNTKFLIVTEGEADALAAFDLLKKQNKNYQVVSILNSSTVKQNYELLARFNDIVLVYDQDKVGSKLAKTDAQILSSNKVKIASWKEFKDANDILRGGHSKIFLDAIYSAKEYRPDGIIRLSQAWDKLFEDDSIKSVPYPWEGLNRKLYGIRPREIVTLTAGSGSGKSAICREIQYSLLEQLEGNEHIGILALEENIGRTAWGLMGIAANKPLHIREERKGFTEEDFRKFFNKTVGTGKYVAYDHFGSTNSDNLLNQIRYMIKAMDCKYIFLDHLSIVVSDMDEVGDERRTIDTIMTKLRQLTEETGASLFNVVHLRRASGDKGHENGTEVSLNHLRGSHSIAHLSDAVIAAERNQQADNDIESNLTTLRVLKNRYAGYVGLGGYLYYDNTTGRLNEVEDKVEFLTEKLNEAEESEY